MPNHNNDFERLVSIACKQRWCWRLYCTTCGSMPFRKSLELIGEGRLPEVIEVQSIKNCPISDYPEIAFARDKALAQCCAEADLDRLSKLPMPDWLGCMGLVLYRFETPAPNSQRNTYWQQISASWASQFIRKIEPSTVAHGLLKRCIHEQEVLRWQDLTPIEQVLEIEQ